MEHRLLVGRKAISSFLGRSWDIIYKWHVESGLPVAKIDGQWEAISSDLLEWKREMICNEIHVKTKEGG